MSAVGYALWAMFAALLLSALAAARQALRPENVAAWRRDIADEAPDRDRLAGMPNFATLRAQREDPERIARAGKRNFIALTVAALALLTYILTRS
jgi:hypothetical protein